MNNVAAPAVLFKEHWRVFKQELPCLKDAALMLVLAELRYRCGAAGEWQVRYGLLCNVLKTYPRHLRRLMHELCERGYIEITVTHRGKGRGTITKVTLV
jgi:hypothetical protein